MQHLHIFLLFVTDYISSSCAHLRLIDRIRYERSLFWGRRSLVVWRWYWPHTKLSHFWSDYPLPPTLEKGNHNHEVMQDLQCSLVTQTCIDCGQNYEDYKKQCDEYFYLKHRDEMRGVGGIFFDHLKAPSKTACLQFISNNSTHLQKTFIIWSILGQ